MTTPRSGSRRRLPAVVLAAAVGLIVLAVGVVGVNSRSSSSNATATLLVVPDARAPTEQLAGLYDTLSRGQVVESYAALASSGSFQRPVIQGLRLPAEQQRSLKVMVHVVPNTALIDIVVSADHAAVAEATADALASQAAARLPALLYPYRLSSVSSAAGTAETAGPGATALLVIVALLALAAGAATYMGLVLILPSRRSRDGRDQSPLIFPFGADPSNSPTASSSAHSVAQRLEDTDSEASDVSPGQAMAPRSS